MKFGIENITVQNVNHLRVSYRLINVVNKLIGYVHSELLTNAAAGVVHAPSRLWTVEPD